MAVPRSRVSNARKNKRRSHHATAPKATTICKNCLNPHLPHHMCNHCGQYKGRAYGATPA